jgi:hypothetical protein
LVVRLDAADRTAVEGPLTCVHAVLEIVAPPLPDAVPVKLTVEVGNVIVCAEPALTVGATSTTAAFTVIVTVEVEVCELLSVAASWNT